MKIKKKLWLAGMLWLLLAFNVAAQTNTIVGLVVVVKYKDYKIVATPGQIDAMLNQASGFNLWGNTSSVRQYYLAQSNNKLSLVSTVVDVELTQNSSYYHGPNLPYDGGQLLVKDVVAAVNAKYPAGFSGLTLHPTENRLWHFSIISKSSPTEGAGVSYGLSETQYVKNNAQNMPINNVALISYTTDQNDINVICHEYGHSVMGWTDYYRTAWSNLGNYCLMASAGSDAAPMPVNPALRLRKGWIDNVIPIGVSTLSQSYTATSNSYNTIYKYTNPYNSKEYLLIHPQVYGGYYQSLIGGGAVPDQGLAIYYVDEDGGMDVPGVETQPMIRLVQADNLDELQTDYSPDVRGDLEDLYDNVKNSFPNGTPFRWKDGGEFGLSINGITAPAATMSFSVFARPATFIARTDNNGTISPSGVVGVPSGQSQTFTLSPYPNYVLNQVKLDGVVTATSGNSFTTTARGTKTVDVTYIRKPTPDPLPSPWQHGDIGNSTTSGIAGHASGKFYLESFGNDIGGNYDNFRFVYQPLNGDVSIVAKLSYANKPSDFSKAGIMIRESLQPNAAYSMLMYTPLHHTRVQQRSVTGAYTIDDPNQNDDRYEHIYNLYKWFKITRQGNVITSSCSRDKITWVQMAQQTIAMSANIYLGMAVSGANGNYPSRAIFDSVAVTRNIPPTVSITSPANLATFTSPATINITANASDANGSIFKVEFYNGSILLGNDFTAPYSYSWTNVPNGDKTITVVAMDNEGALSSATILVTVKAPTAILSGPACGINNTTLTYTLDPSKRTNATGYNWYYSGGSANSIVPVSGSPYIANLSTGPYFSSGQVCVGVNYSGAPYSATYCVSVAKCSTTARIGDVDMVVNDLATESTLSYPNPFTSEITIQLPHADLSARIQVYNAIGILVADETVIGGVYKFGSQLSSGIYFVKINTEFKTETIKVVKE